METRIKKKLSFAELSVRVTLVGDDCHLLLSGGNRPHIGCAVLAVPRESLSGSGEPSCTSSVLNLTGHKDEQLCRTLAEAVCRKLGTVTLCTGGFHVDHMTKEQLEELIGALPLLEKQIIQSLLENLENCTNGF